MSTKEERARATRAALMEAARALFTERGYADVGTEEIVARAGVTRGALYHHFADKRDLFRAVHERVEQEAVERIGASMEEGQDPIELLLTGACVFLDLCEDPAWTRIPLIDAPSVLGWAEWREIDLRYGLGLVTGVLEAAMDTGAIARRPVGPLAHMLVASMGELGLMIATADDPAAARSEAEPALLALIEGLRA